MNNIKGYNEFLNEEKGWKSAVAGGLAVLGTLGMAGCDAPIAMDVKTKTEVTQNVDKEGKIIYNRKVVVYTGKATFSYALVYIETTDGKVYKVIVSWLDSPVKNFKNETKMVNGEKVTLHLSDGEGYIIWRGEKLDLTNDYLAWEEAREYTN